MRRIRVIPVLLVQNGGLVKSVKFKNYKYVGDPINTVKIFNDKEVDEIVILDIEATVQKRPPNIDQIKEIASEAFMPLAYGGGISTLNQIKQLLFEGVEKIVINTNSFNKPSLISEGAKQFGSQSIIVSIDVKKNWLGHYQIYSHGGKQKTPYKILDFAKKVEDLGAGEIFLNSIDRDGTFQGFDLDLIKKVSMAVNIPVIACGGAKSTDDFLPVIKETESSAIAAGSMFVFNGPHRAVLISYPSQEELKTKLFNHL